MARSELKIVERTQLFGYLFSFFGFSSQSFWKRGSFRRGSNMGSSRSSAGVSGTFGGNGPEYGIESSFCKAAMARSGSPVCAATRARISIGPGPVVASLLDRIHGHGLFDQSQRGGFVAKAHIGQREVSNEAIVFRLFFEERFQFAARLSPTFLGGGMVTGDFLRPA